MKTRLICWGIIWGCSFLAGAAEPWTLENAVAYALQHSPDARIARHRIAAAQAGLRQANASFMPKLQFQKADERIAIAALRKALGMTQLDATLSK